MGARIRTAPAVKRLGNRCVVVLYDGAAWSSVPTRTPSPFWQSSSQPEYIGAIRLASEMLHVKELVKFMEFGTSLEVECVASSATAIETRRDLGRLRHLEVKWLWLQQLVGAGLIRIVYVKSTENLLDVGTKFMVKCREGLIPARIDAFRSGMAAVLTTLEAECFCVATPHGARHRNHSGGPANARSHRSGDLHDQLDSSREVEDPVHDRWHCAGSNGGSCDQEVRDEPWFLASETTTTRK